MPKAGGDRTHDRTTELLVIPVRGRKKRGGRERTSRRGWAAPQGLSSQLRDKGAPASPLDHPPESELETKQVSRGTSKSGEIREEVGSPGRAGR